MSEVMDITKPAETVKCWVELYSDKLFSWAFYKTSHKETAEDLVQDTFIVAFQSIGRFKEMSDPKTWLLGILNNKIAEHFRKVYRNPTINESDSGMDSNVSFFEFFFDSDGTWKKEKRPKDWQPDASHLLDDSDFTKTLKGCMEKLPQKWVAAVNLKYLEEKNGEEICQELQISPTNFWQILHRAKLQLRSCLEIHWFKK